MTQEKIIEGNKLIAEFMGNLGDDYARKNANNKMFYHESWDCLMPVVEKIDTVALDNYGEFEVVIYSNLCCIQTDRNNPEIQQTSNVSRLDATYKAVIEFIKLYNLHNPSTPTNDK